MRVALVNPGIDKYNDSPPLNLGFMAAYLEQHNHRVKIIDKLAGDDFFAEIDIFQPDLVGITGTTPVITDAYRVADECRDRGIKTVIGGIHASVMAEEAKKHADAVVIGEGEVILKEIIDKDLTGIIKGKPILKLDELPRPSYHLINMDFYLTVRQRVEISYLSFAPKQSRVASILTSRGCPYNCTFCYNSFQTLPFRFNSAERVIEEIKHLIDEFGVNAIFFIEDNFFCNRPRVKKICNMIIDEELDIIWGANSRVDNINKEILALAKRAGCGQVTFGWESGSQKMLDTYKKRTTVAQNVKSVELCKEVGVWSNGTLMIGGPKETEKDIRLTQKFIQENPITGGIGVCITTPYPGTELWKWCLAEKRIPEDFKWDHFDYHHVPIKMHNMKDEKFLELAVETRRMAIDKFMEQLKSQTYM